MLNKKTYSILAVSAFCATGSFLSGCNDQTPTQIQKEGAPVEEVSDGPKNDSAKLPQSFYSVDLIADRFRVPGGYNLVEEGDLLRISGPSVLPSSAGKTAAISFQINQDLEKLFAGNNIRLTVKARGDEGSKLASAYSTSSNGNSGWKQFELSSSLGEYSFDYLVPKLNESNYDYIGIAPFEGNVQIESISIACPACNLPNRQYER